MGLLSFLGMTDSRAVSGDRARQLVAEGASLLDVRTPDEFRQDALPGALNIPVQILGDRFGELPRDKPVVVYCASGMRSASAAQFLERCGFTQVYDLGGIGRW